MIVWIFGLSGAGKTSVGELLTEHIRQELGACVCLDGDVLREVFGNDLGHTVEDRLRNSWRLAHLALFLERQQIPVVVPTLAFFEEVRACLRERASAFFDIYLKCELETLIHRDSKGLYKAALDGEITDVVGIDIEFSEPETCKLILRNDFSVAPEQLTQSILQQLAV